MEARAPKKQSPCSICKPSAALVALECRSSVAPPQVCRSRRAHWGSYLVGDPNKIWLNIHTGLPNRKKSDRDEDQPTLTQLFPYSIEPSSVIVIDQRNVHDSYVVALLGLIHTINSRQNKDARAGWSAKFGVFARTRAMFGVLDELYLGAPDLDKLIELLALDAFLQTSPDKSSRRHHELYPSTETMLSDLASDWVGEKARFSSFEAL